MVYLHYTVVIFFYRSLHTPPLSYKDAGVDIVAGDNLVQAIKPLAASSNRSGCMAALGSFGALFDLKAAGYKDPILVSGTDGVGTKLKVWFSMRSLYRWIIHKICNF